MSTEAKNGIDPRSTPTEGVSQQTWDFLHDVVKTGVYTTITAEHRNMIGVYYGSDASVRDLQKVHGYAQFSSVKYRIQKGMAQLWSALPSEVREKYNPDVVVMMKLGMSEATRKKMSQARHRRWDNDPEYRNTILGHNQARREQYRVENPPRPKELKPPREKKSKKSTLPVGSPEDRARKSLNQKRRWDDPIIGARLRDAAKHRVPSETVSASLKAVWQDPGYREEMSIIRRETWEDPIHRENMTIGIQRGTRTLEAREKRSKLSKAMWDDPEFKKKRIADIKTMWTVQDFRERMLALMLEGRVMPDRKAKIDSVARSLRGLTATTDSILSENFTHRIEVAIRRLRLPSVNAQEATAEVWLSIAEEVKKGNSLSDQDLARIIGNHVADIVNMKVKDRYETTSLDKPLREGKGATATLGHIIGVEDNDLKRITDQQLGDAMISALERLEPFGRQLVYEIIIQEKPMEEVAEALKISVEETQEELNQAIIVLRKSFLEK